MTRTLLIVLLALIPSLASAQETDPKLELLNRLYDWGEMQGGFDAPIWREVATVVGKPFGRPTSPPPPPVIKLTTPQVNAMHYAAQILRIAAARLTATLISTPDPGWRLYRVRAEIAAALSRLPVEPTP